MKQILTKGIVLARTNYQEADRILTILTPDQGKLHVLARGVRKSRSKMAGGVELFSVSEIGFMRGRGELATLTTSRLLHHYGHIAKDIDRTMLGYDLIKLLHKATEDNCDHTYFELLQTTLEALNDKRVSTDLIKLWFYAQLLKLAGHSPNLRTDTNKQPLRPDADYIFSYDDMAFFHHPDGHYHADHIKFLRLVFSDNSPQVLQKVQMTSDILADGLQIIQNVPAHQTT